MQIDLLRASCVISCVLAAHAAWAQPEQATAKGDSVKVYREMSARSQVVGVLKAGDVVQVGLSMTGEEGSWCGVARIDPPGNLGYVLCGELARQPRRQDAAPAANTSGECSHVVEQAFKVAGLKESIAGLSEQVRSGLEAQLPAEYGPTVKRRIIEAVATAFSPERMGPRIKQEFVDSCDLETFEQVIAGLTTPLGAKMIGMEVSAASPQGIRQVSGYAGTLARHPPTRERLILMQRMDDSQGISAFEADGIIALARGLNAVGGLTYHDVSMTRQELKSLRKTILEDLLFTYRAASDQEIAQYIELNETQAFRKFNEIFKKAFLDSVGEQSQEAELEVRKLTEPRGR
jgi:hypothetical protein